MGLFKLWKVRKHLGVEDICLTRRFVILQGSGDEVKPRVIDDAKESAVNSAYTALERLELHDFDHMVSIASLISSIYGGDGMVRISELDGQVVQKPIHKELLGNCRWQGRCLDLSKAYKQVPIDRTSRGLMVLLAPEPGSQQPKFFTTSSMPFGCASSVFAFNRITRSLLHLFHKLLKMPSGVFYDDFALLEPSAGATLASMAAENLLELLGWKYAKEGSKASKFEPCFNLLGAQLNLASLHEGFVKVSNKPSRLVKLKELLAAMKQNRHISKSEAQSMHGLLNYASGFFLEQSLKTASRAFANLVARPHGADGDEVAKLCDFTHAMLEISKPRSWNCWTDDWPIIVFTDGAYEDPKGTWGAVVFGPADGKTSTYYAGDVPSRLMEGWKKLAGEQIICQIEAFAVLLIRQHFSEAWKEKRAIFFVDNEAARFSLIKGSSPSPSMQLIAHLFHQLDASSPLMVWIERVPSASNMVSIASLISSIYGGDGMVRISELDGQVVQKPIHKELLGNCRWQGRCLDLSKAYKQVPIDRTSRGLMVLLAPEPGSQQPKFFTTSSMPFGCASSVFAFNRITRSLLHLFHKLLKMPSGVFYDDFALLEPSAGATLASMAAENLLELLGWKYAKEGSKASKFEPCFNLLGAQLNLASLHEGFVKVSNKPSRLVKLKELLAAMKQNRHISKSEAQSMHGLLNYASGFFLGQSLKTASRAFANLVARPHGADGDEVAKLCDFTHAMLEISKPRSWNCWTDDWPIIVFTDGAYEDPKGTWGAVVFEPADGKTSTYYAGDVPSRLMEGWKKLAGEQIICQIEAFAVLLIRQHFSEAWKEKRAIFFVDNEAARFSLIKGSSPSPSMQLIAHLFHQLDASSPLMVWIERVPSASNIADLPSRGKWEETLKIVGGTFEGDIKLPDHMVEELVTSKILPVELLRKSND